MSVGNTVGNLYALSTVGSIAGTLATSFYLIAIAGVNTLILSQGVLLLIISASLLFMDFSRKTEKNCQDKRIETSININVT